MNATRDIIVYQDQSAKFHNFVILDSFQVLFALEASAKSPHAHLFGVKITKKGIGFFKDSTPAYKVPIGNETRKIMVDLKKKLVLTNGGFTYTPYRKNGTRDSIGNWKIYVYMIDKSGFLKSKVKHISASKFGNVKAKDINGSPVHARNFYVAALESL